MRLYIPSLATLIAFLGLAISTLFLLESMSVQENRQSLVPTLPNTRATNTAPAALNEPFAPVDIYPLSTRPLFASNRRVPEVVIPEVTEPEAPALPITNQTPQPETSQPPELVMIGILLDGPTPKALIRDAEGVEMWVENGEFIEGWQIVRVSTQSITLQLNDESVDIYSID